MRYLALAVLTAGVTAQPGRSLAADLSGHWRYFQRDAIEVSPRTYDHSADFILWQRGNLVYGTWSESGYRGSQGCVKGTVKSRSMQAQLCLQDGSFGSESRAVCPAYAPPRDRFDRSGKSLVWYRYNDQTRKWEKYVTLTRRSATSKATWPEKCGADGPRANVDSDVFTPIGVAGPSTPPTITIHADGSM